MQAYGLEWGQQLSAIGIEFRLIHAGGYLTIQGVQYGKGLFHHFRAALILIWPEDDNHRWSDLIIKEYLENRLVAVAGSRDSGKTRTISKCALLDYYLYSEEILILMTSTNMRGLELRVWGDIKSLHERAKKRFTWLPGNVSDSKHGIFTDSITDGEDVRDMRKGVLCRPDMF